MQSFSYSQPVKIEFGVSKLDKLEEIILSNDYKKGVVICSRGVVNRGILAKVQNACPQIVGEYHDVTPNPLVSEVENAINVLVSCNADFCVAIGGGSVLDLAKFACVGAKEKYCVSDYFYGKQKLSSVGIPLIAIPTTSGTGSEVTNVSVLNDNATGIKGPVVYSGFFPKHAIVDPLLTISMPQYVTATTGMDAMAHAMEAYWTIHHQPICDNLSIQALKLIFGSLKASYDNGDNLDARIEMSAGSLIAGLAFAPTRTAGVHGASYPLSINYHLTHGEACAFTLDEYIRLTASYEKERMQNLAYALDFSNVDAMADEVLKLKRHFGLKTTLEEVGIKDIKTLSSQCAEHLLTKNNPGNLTAKELEALFNNIG